VPGINHSLSPAQLPSGLRQADAHSFELGGVHAPLARELVLADDQLDACIEAITSAARTGKIGDGKIFVSEVARVVRIRTGEENEAAI